MPRPITNLSGRVFGRLTVISFCRSMQFGQRKRTVYRCQCSCGAIYFATGDRLVSGNTKSCGCLRRDMGRVSIRAAFKVRHKVKEPQC